MEPDLGSKAEADTAACLSAGWHWAAALPAWVITPQEDAREPGLPEMFPEVSRTTG